MLQIQLVDSPSSDLVALSKIHYGPITPSRLYTLALFGSGAPAFARNMEFEEILYTDTEHMAGLLNAAGDFYISPTMLAMGTTVCSKDEDPLPLYFYHTAPGLPEQVQISVIDSLGRELNPNSYLVEPQSATSNARIYLRQSGHFQILYQSEDFHHVEQATLRPVMPPWLWRSDPYGGDWLKVNTDYHAVAVDQDEGNIEVFRLAIRPGRSSPALRVFGLSSQLQTVELSSTRLKLKDAGTEVLDLELAHESRTFGQVRDRINALENWRCELLVPARTRTGRTGVTYLTPIGTTAVDPVQGQVLRARTFFVTRLVKQQMSVVVPELPPTHRWIPHISPGSFTSWEFLQPEDIDAIEKQLGVSIHPHVAAQWRVDSTTLSRKALEQHGQILGQSAEDSVEDNERPIDVQAEMGQLGPTGTSHTLEQLVAIDLTGRRFRASRGHLLNAPIIDVWVGDTYYANPSEVFQSIDTSSGEFLTRFTIQEPIRIRYRFFEQTLDFDGYLDPIEGRWKSLELNPRLQPAQTRYKSVILVLLPYKITVFVKDSGSTADQRTFINSSVLRFMHSDNPDLDTSRLADLPITKFPVGSGEYIRAPFRALAVLYWTPAFSPATVPIEDVRSQGGGLLPLDNPIRLQNQDSRVRSWELLTSRKAYQLSRCLLIYLPRSLGEHYTEDQIRKKIQTFLPAAAFYDIIWYD